MDQDVSSTRQKCLDVAELFLNHLAAKRGGESGKASSLPPFLNYLQLAACRPTPSQDENMHFTRLWSVCLCQAHIWSYSPVKQKICCLCVAVSHCLKHSSDCLPCPKKLWYAMVVEFQPKKSSIMQMDAIGRVRKNMEGFESIRKRKMHCCMDGKGPRTIMDQPPLYTNYPNNKARDFCQPPAAASSTSAQVPFPVC